jgi:hypothetical protein
MPMPPQQQAQEQQSQSTDTLTSPVEAKNAPPWAIKLPPTSDLI